MSALDTRKITRLDKLLNATLLLCLDQNWKWKEWKWVENIMIF